MGPACPTAATPCLSATGVVSSANLRSAAVAPGQIVTIFGRGIGPETGAFASMPPESGNLPVFLADTQVFFGGVSAPLLYVQANQVNAIVPFEMTGRDSAASPDLAKRSNHEPGNRFDCRGSAWRVHNDRGYKRSRCCSESGRNAQLCVEPC